MTLHILHLALPSFSPTLFLRSLILWVCINRTPESSMISFGQWQGTVRHLIEGMGRDYSIYYPTLLPNRSSGNFSMLKLQLLSRSPHLQGFLFLQAQKCSCQSWVASVILVNSPKPCPYPFKYFLHVYLSIPSLFSYLISNDSTFYTEVILDIDPKKCHLVIGILIYLKSTESLKNKNETLEWTQINLRIPNYP